MWFFFSTICHEKPRMLDKLGKKMPVPFTRLLFHSRFFLFKLRKSLTNVSFSASSLSRRNNVQYYFCCKKYPRKTEVKMFVQFVMWKKACFWEDYRSCIILRKSAVPFCIKLLYVAKPGQWGRTRQKETPVPLRERMKSWLVNGYKSEPFWRYVLWSTNGDS